MFITQLKSHCFPQIAAIFSKPDASRLVFPKDTRLQSVPLFLLCDNIRDAGNLGTILRCAAAAGCERVLLTKGVFIQKHVFVENTTFKT